MNDGKVEAHFVTFYSPGTFFNEETTQAIPSWDVEKAMEMARSIKERHAATPFGFSFSTRARGPRDLDSKEIATGPMHYLGGKIETREEIEARNLPDEDTLRSNLRINDIARVIVNTNSWKVVRPLYADDVVLDFRP
jgi:hypothetical protein